jgi:hypothetical protein
LVILGIKIPFEVETTSNREEGSGDDVPTAAAPVEGNVFVCAMEILLKKISGARRRENRKMFFMSMILEKQSWDHKQALTTTSLGRGTKSEVGSP